MEVRHIQKTYSMYNDIIYIYIFFIQGEAFPLPQCTWTYMSTYLLGSVEDSCK